MYDSSRFLREEDNVICFDSYDDAIIDRIIKINHHIQKTNNQISL